MSYYTSTILQQKKRKNLNLGLAGPDCEGGKQTQKGGLHQRDAPSFVKKGAAKYTSTPTLNFKLRSP